MFASGVPEQLRQVLFSFPFHPRLWSRILSKTLLAAESDSCPVAFSVEPPLTRATPRHRAPPRVLWSLLSSARPPADIIALHIVCLNAFWGCLSEDFSRRSHAVRFCQRLITQGEWVSSVWFLRFLHAGAGRFSNTYITIFVILHDDRNGCSELQSW